MKYIRIVTLPLFFLFSSYATAQDSTRTINHEIGFNTVSLIKQLISNNPATTLAELPYDVFYNMYYKDKVGIRVGLGLATTHLETSEEGQPAPRTSNQTALNLRAGLSYNFVKSRRLTLNTFADFIYAQNKLYTSNTTTVQSFPNPMQSITVESTDKTTGIGGQIGVGVKYNIYRHLSIYAEVPITFLSEKTSSTVYINEDGFPSKTTTSTTKTTSTRIILPATVYLVLRF